MVTITLDNLTKYFGPTAAVDSVHLAVPAGALWFLLGPSGCGKTTLLRMVAGFVMPDAGRIRFDEQDLTFVPPYQRDTGMVFQSYALWPHMTIADNVGFGLDVRHITGRERAARVDQALALVQMAELKDRKPNQLSGGQQQRIALARALAIRPKCLLLDEPLSNLDAKLRLEMRSEIRRIVKEIGITAIYVTHDQKEALSMADHIAVMKAGRIQQTGTPAELYRHPANRFVADFIGETNFLKATVESTSGNTVTVRTPVGTLQAALPQIQNSEFRIQNSVLAAFRPEAVTLAAAGTATPNTFAGRRIATTYLGEMAEHLIELADGTRIKAFELNPSATQSPDNLVALHIPPENLMLVSAD
jgi:iron(III) transport system ATP-binding protein